MTDDMIFVIVTMCDNNLQGDVRELKDCESAVKATTDKWGSLDILINAAAGNFLSPAEILTPKGFKTGTDLSLIINQTQNMSTVNLQ